MADERSNSTSQTVDKVISRRSQGLAGGKPLPTTRSRIIKRATIGRQRFARHCVIGGDSPDAAKEAPPVIILEKDADDVIRRVTVKCPCGRHAELVFDND